MCITDSRNDYIRDFLGVTKWHAAGYTGKYGLTASGENFEAATEPSDHAHETLEAFHEIAPDRKVIHIRLSDVGKLIKQTGKRGVDSMYVSLSTQGFPSNLREKIDDQLPKRTTIFVSAGNYGDERYNHYMKPERVYGVGAVRLTKKGKVYVANYTSVSELVDFAGITDLDLPPNRKIGGTSCAAPVLCGMAALVNDFFIQHTGRPLSDAAMYRFLKDHTTDVFEEGKDEKTGWGLPILPDPKTIDIDKYREDDDMIYKDDKDINHSHKGDVYRALDLGLMQGSDGSFEPKEPLTREQMATVAVRLYDKIMEKVEE